MRLSAIGIDGKGTRGLPSGQLERVGRFFAKSVEIAYLCYEIAREMRLLCFTIGAKPDTGAVANAAAPFSLLI